MLANVMIPTIAGHIIIMIVLILPIAAIEAFVIKTRHAVSYKKSLELALSANSKSTVVGLPLGYLLAFLGVIPVGIFASLLPAYIKSPIGVILGNVLTNGGRVPNVYDEVGFFAGTLLVMIPYYIVSVWVELRYIAKNHSGFDRKELKKTVQIMNRITYALLAIPVAWGTVNAINKLAN